MGKFSKLYLKESEGSGVAVTKDKVVTESAITVVEAKLLQTHTNGNKSAKVYGKDENGEHVVKFHKGGVHQKNADYHTDDKEDAHGTAKHWVNSVKESAEDYNTLDESALLRAYLDGSDAARSFLKKFISEGDRSEHSANIHLSNGSSGTSATGYHVFTKTKRGTRKSISGPFNTAQEAENHPHRKLGDGVCTSAQCEK